MDSDSIRVTFDLETSADVLTLDLKHDWHDKVQSSLDNAFLKIGHSFTMVQLTNDWMYQHVESPVSEKKANKQ